MRRADHRSLLPHAGAGAAETPLPTSFALPPLPRAGEGRGDGAAAPQTLRPLRDLQRELGVSYLFITHNIGVVEYIADFVAVMRAGRIEEQGACADVLERPRSEYTRSLLAAVPRLVLA